MEIKYKPEIDGLRAIAILSVVLYHFYPKFLQGGFVGVDIFFAISGYLITLIILKECHRGCFSFKQFYLRRIKRLFPAFFVVIFMVTFASLLIMTPLEFSLFKSHILSSLSYSSNIIYYSESGYFDTNSSYKPLLHTWSLSVEEQFYIVWPFIIYFSMKYKMEKHVVSICILISLFFSIYLSYKNPSAAYFLPFSRLWEMGMGAGLAIIQTNKINNELIKLAIRKSNNNAIFVLGLLMISIPAFYINPNDSFPFPWAIPPVIGSLLVIMSAEDIKVGRLLLCNNFFVFVGLISYSLYLWHWPLIALAKTVNQGELSSVALLSLLLLSFVFAILTYFFVERPIKNIKTKKEIEMLAFFLLFTFIVFALVIVLGADRISKSVAKEKLERHLSNYLGNNINIIKAYKMRRMLSEDAQTPVLGTKNCRQIMEEDNPAYKFCRLHGDDNSTKGYIVLWGDSFAHAWRWTFMRIAKEKNRPLIVIAHVGCPPILGVKRTDQPFSAEFCQDSTIQNGVVSVLKNLEINKIFLASRWNLYLEGHIKNKKLVENSFISSLGFTADVNKETAEKVFNKQMKTTANLLSTIAPVIIFEGTPTLYLPPAEGERKGGRYYPSLDEYEKIEKVSMMLFSSLKGSVHPINSFSFSDELCTDDCYPVINGIPIYSDETHLTQKATNLFLTKIINEHFK